MTGGKILPFDKNLSQFVKGKGARRILVLPAEMDMVKLKHRRQFSPIFTANVADILFLALAFPNGEDVRRFFSAEQTADILVQLWPVIHFVVGKVLGDKIQNVATKPVNAKIRPKLYDFFTLFSYRFVFPVQVRLFFGKTMQIIFMIEEQKQAALKLR